MREVREEIGFDISRMINKDVFFQKNLHGKRVKLFVVDGINADTAEFLSHTRHEISDIQWSLINELPELTAGSPLKKQLSFVQPFIPDILAYVKKKKSERKVTLETFKFDKKKIARALGAK